MPTRGAPFFSSREPLDPDATQGAEPTSQLAGSSQLLVTQHQQWPVASGVETQRLVFVVVLIAGVFMPYAFFGGLCRSP
jgi:hypothetical protein